MNETFLLDVVVFEFECKKCNAVVKNMLQYEYIKQ